ncbi:hypothetical protein CHS0354_024387 [Potamilus streckersoni]|uniref:Methyltransferase FkbM domain-containing protein n=1 Tax=Potamilus streckersoni TaxID=2493646 RepID=A0AAE0SVU5_9BIVA|nr:hypothetical protein CHS0354_024387 [Potamilus streckersoni]
MKLLRRRCKAYYLGCILTLTIGIIIWTTRIIMGPTKVQFSNVSHKFQPFIQLRNTSFDYREETMKMNEEKVEMDDPRLIELIRNYWIEPPSKEPYNLKKDLEDYSAGQTPYADSRLNHKANGFFIEAGAYDGESSSTSLFFEKYRKWNGLLVEPDPRHYYTIQSKHRKAYRINACLSTKPYPIQVTFNIGHGLREQMGRIHETKEAEEWIQKENIGFTSIKVQCFPLYSLLLAMQVNQVDFFTLDVEGEELHVLKTIPFDKINIGMMTVEYIHSSEEEITRFLEEKGYRKMIKMRTPGCADIIFRKNDIPFIGYE